MEQTELKEAIKEIIPQKAEMWVSWDAGGDQTICDIDSHEDLFENNGQLYEAIIDLIIDTLDLPNAGEYYHRGKGAIYCNDNDEIILTFTSKEYTSDYEENKLILPIDDKYHWTRYLHKAEIEWQYEGLVITMMQPQLVINTKEGDAFSPPPTEVEYYEQHIGQIFAEECTKIERQKATKKLEVENFWLIATLQAEPPKINLALDAQVMDTTRHENEEIVLIP